MKGYKGFHKGLICKNKQYKENTVFEEPDAEICMRGMHFCANPMDVLDYYGFIGDNCTLNEFAEVESLAKEDSNDGKKFCTTKLKVEKKLSISQFIRACVDFNCQHDNNSSKLAASGDYAQLAASGDYAQLAASGDGAKLAASGVYAKLAASGGCAKLAASGDGAKLAASGGCAQLAASGDYAQLAASGDGAKLAASGGCAQLAASGDYAQLVASGCDSVAAGIGANNIAKASIGSWIVLAEWAMKNGKYIPVCVKCAQVDGEKIKPDTFYKLKNGEFVEVYI